ncbi:unnamed protein product [Sphagnum troendelagicum]
MAPPDGGLALLKLHDWANSPISISLFRSASLSPSRSRLMLLSRTNHALLVPLHALHSISSNNGGGSLPSAPTPAPPQVSSPCSISPSSFSTADVGATSSMSPDPGGGRLESPSLGFPHLSGVDCFAWACSGDGYAANRGTGTFRELLLVAGDEGIFIHCFCHHGEEFKAATTSEIKSPISEKLRENEQSKGRWRNWGGPGRTGFEAKAKGDYDNEIAKPQPDVEEKASRGKCKLDFGESEGESEVKDGDRGIGFQSFAINVELENDVDGLRFQFSKHHFWPSSAEVVSFCIAKDSPSFSNLIWFAKDGADGGSEQKNPSNPGDLEQAYCVSDILSGTSHSLVALVITKRLPATVSVDEFKLPSKSQDEEVNKVGEVCKDYRVESSDKQRKRWRDCSDISVSIASVSDWGMKWVSRINFDAADLVQTGLWADFELANELFLGLKDHRFLFLWAALSGQLVACIDVLQYCGLGFTGLQISQEDLITKSGTDEIQQKNKHQFVQLAVTADCLLVAITDTKGLVYLVSMDNYLTSCPLPSSQTLGSSCCDLRVFSSYEVAGSDIGGAKSCSLIPDHQMLKGDSRNRVEIKSVSRSETGAFSSSGSGIRGLSMGPSGLTSRAYVAQHTIAGVSASKNHLQPLRRVLLPVNPSGCFVGMALNAYSVTRVATSNGPAFTVVQNGVRVQGGPLDEAQLGTDELPVGYKQSSYGGDVLAFGCQGSLYIVSATSLHVVLPPLDSFVPQAVGSKGPWWLTERGCKKGLSKWDCMLPLDSNRPAIKQWQTQVLDRFLAYNGLEEAECLCVENGWSLQLLRLRRLELALDHVRVEEIEQALEALVHVGAAEVGVPRVLFAAVKLIISPFASDNELAQASRLLALAARFSTRLVRRHGIAAFQELQHQKKDIRMSGWTSLSSFGSTKESNKFKSVSSITELASFLQVIRSLQDRLQAKLELPSDAVTQITTDLENVASGGSTEQARMSLGPQDVPSVVPTTALVATTVSSGTAPPWDFSVGSGEDVKGHGSTLLESAGEMFARWESMDVDVENVVRDALRAGRVPLAVVQLHRKRLKAFMSGSEEYHPEMVDVFQEVQDIGRAIVYEFLCKGKTALAMAALRRLGEDIEVALYELSFGTVRRSLRKQVILELRRNATRLGSFDSRLLEITKFFEDLYPSSSFWSTYKSRQHHSGMPRVDEPTSTEDNLYLEVVSESKDARGFTIQCSEVDGVALGSWNTTATQDDDGVDEDNSAAGYLVLAAVWLHSWDQRTVDRVILDQSLVTGEHTSWGAQLEYHVVHHNWPQVSALLDAIPHSVMYEGELQVHLGFDETVVLGEADPDVEEAFSPKGGNKEVKTVIPNVHILGIDMRPMSSAWLWHMMDMKLIKNHIFLRTHWQGTAELVSLLASAGLLFHHTSSGDFDNVGKQQSADGMGVHKDSLHKDTVQAFHELVVQHSVKHSLMNLLECYCNHHSLALDEGSATMMQAILVGSHWAECMVLSRLEDHEYDASFANARAILPDTVATVDDMAASGRPYMAMATLMYAPCPLQKCLIMGDVNRHSGQSSACSLASLQQELKSFPTLWLMLVTAVHGQDAWSFLGSSPETGSMRGWSSYLEWREGLHKSAARDTSLLQMLPDWLPKDVSMLLRLTIQGPIGGAQGALEHAREGEEAGVLAFEAAIEASVEEEVYATSSKEAGLGIEHHLLRGRPLAAFNSLIVSRVDLSSVLPQSSKYVSSAFESQAPLSSLTKSEEADIAMILGFTIIHYDDAVVVASCVCFLELCGLSAHLLQVDVAALRRIAKYLQDQNSEVLPPDVQGSTPMTKVYRADVVGSLSQALADEYTSAGIGMLSGKGFASQRPCKVYTRILQLLEKTLEYEGPKKVENTAGTWLLNAVGDGTELRAVQRSMSERWSLVTAFCRGHQLPLSTTYLAALARDNDWVGFLAEAQVECCPLDILLKVASKEFTDVRLQSHILTVLKSIPTAPPKASTAQGNLYPFSAGLEGEALPAAINGTSGELFGLLAECEKCKYPGLALLAKAKDLRWPLLAVVASCFSDVTSLSCLTAWLEITAARETSAIRVNDAAAHISASVGAAVEATNAQAQSVQQNGFTYDRRQAKRRRLLLPKDTMVLQTDGATSAEEVMESNPNTFASVSTTRVHGFPASKVQIGNEDAPSAVEAVAQQELLASMVAVLCEQQRFLPLLRAFELFSPMSALLPFIRFLQAFSQLRISEAAAHLAAFSTLLKEEIRKQHGQQTKIGKAETLWITAAAVAAADAMLEACPSVYERRCLLQLLSAADFGDGGQAAMRFRRFYWKMQLAEPALRSTDLVAGAADLDDEALLTVLETNGHWEESRSWARQLDLSLQRSNSALHHVTETQAEAMVAEWKELLWDVPEERSAVWGHCQSLFIRHGFPPLQAGKFFLRHADAVVGEFPKSELHGILLLALQWLSGSFTNSTPVYPLPLLHELEIRVWLLAVESEVEMQSSRDEEATLPGRSSPPALSGQQPHKNNTTSGSPVDRTASAVAMVDSHLKQTNIRPQAESLSDEPIRGLSRSNSLPARETSASPHGSGSKTKRRTKQVKRTPLETPSGSPPSDTDDNRRSSLPMRSHSRGLESDSILLDATSTPAEGVSGWEEHVGEGEVESAVLALLEVGQVTAAKQLQQKLAPTHVPLELLLVETAHRIAMLSQPTTKGAVVPAFLHPSVLESLASTNLLDDFGSATPMQVLNALTAGCRENCGRGLCRRITAVAQIANFLGLPFAEAFQKSPPQLLQLVSLKGQEALSEAKLLVATHSMPAATVARILAESFLKGLLAAHRGGYMESSQREEGPAPLLWRTSDFKQWAKLCSSEPEVGHALMRLVIGGRDIPHSCEVELIILAHFYYELSACLDGGDVLVSLAATRVDSYVAEGDFTSLARLVTGLSNFQRLRFILDLLIENGQLGLLLQKRDGAMVSSLPAIGFRMAVLSALKRFNSYDLDSFSQVYSFFGMAHEMAELLKSRAQRALERWVRRYDPEHSEELLDPMRFYVEAAEVYAAVDAGMSTSFCCAQASLVSLQLRMPELMWIDLTETNARRRLVEQPRFQEALIVAEAYDLIQSAEWVPVLWEQMRQPGRIDQFLADFVSALPLPSSMLMELARFYRAEVAARGDHMDFTTWLTPGGMPQELARNLGKSMRFLLKHVRDIRVRLQLATVATGFSDIVDTCMQMLDRVPETAGPLILRKGHGGTYIPLM